MKFELDRLVDYSDDEILGEIRRVAALTPEPILSRAIFDNHAKVSSRAVRRRFGSWQAALERAGLPDRYSGAPVTHKMRTSPARAADDKELLQDLKRVGELTGRSVTQVDVIREGRFAPTTYQRRFGSWSKALAAAGLNVAASGRRFTDEDLFENLLAVWTHYGRAPKSEEMSRPPSHATSYTYVARYGSWNRALAAFVERANVEAGESEMQPETAIEPLVVPKGPETKRDEVRKVSIGLRFAVFKRDRFRCVACGRSPSTHPDCILHADHTVPWSKGGLTKLENLRTLCSDCNIGRSNRYDD
jgi:predicted transcriptional regulator